MSSKNKQSLSYWGGLVLLAVLAVPAGAYDLIRGSNGQPTSWDTGPIPMQIKMATTPTLTDGTNFATSVQQAMADWNGLLGRVQFSPTILGAGTATSGDGQNDIVFDTTIYGEAFDTNTLAVTVSYHYVTTRDDGSNIFAQSDIIFNNNGKWSWDSYRGPLAGHVPEDIRRVAIHELGHVLGLDHPDQASPPQSVTAIMNSAESNIDTMQADDIEGAQFLYGSKQPPANDNFDSAFTIYLNGNSAQVTGNNSSATKEGGEPDHDPGSGVGGASVWWKWTAPSDGSLVVSTAGSAFDTLLAAYTGGSVNSLSQLAANDDESSSPHIRTSKVTLGSISGGTTYYFAVDGWDADMGSIRLSLDFTPAVVNVAPTITSQPASQTVNAGQNVQFRVSASGTPTLSYQWQRLPAGSGSWSNLSNESSYSGATSSNLTVSSVTGVMSGDQFRCVATNGIGSDTSSAALLTVNSPPAIALQPTSQVVLAGVSVNFTISATSSLAFVYQWQRLPAGSGTWSNLVDGGAYAGSTAAILAVSGTTLAMSGDQFRCSVTNIAGSTTSNPATLTVTAPPVITSATTATIGVGGSFTYPITATAAPTSYGASGLPAGLVLNTTNGLINGRPTATGVFTVALSATNAVGTGTASLTITVTDASPAVLTQTSGRLALGFGDGTALSVTGFSANGPIDYQWMHDGRPIAGATGSSVTLTDATRADGGAYWLLLSNSVGLTRSAPIFVSVTPKITQVVAWGFNGSGQANVPDGLTNIVAVAAGDYHALALWVHGAVTAWGDNTLGQKNLPGGLTNVAAIAAGGGHSLALKADGTVVAWGDNSYGQASVPAGLSDVFAIAAAGQTSLAVKTDGTVVAWGFNDFGQTAIPAGLAGVVAVSGDGYSSLALKADGTVTAWGAGGLAQQNIPAGLVNVAALARANTALRNDGTVVAWGSYNPDGQFTVPGGLAGVMAIAAGSHHSLALRSNGTVVVWGSNADGAATPPANLTNVLGVSAGLNFSLVLRHDAPVITSQPVNQTVMAGANASFTVAATGPSLFYQWYRRPMGSATWNSLFSSATLPTLTLSGVTLAMNGDQFRCVVSNGNGSATSAATTLTVQIPAPVITTVPGSYVGIPGAEIRLTVAVISPVAVSYQWQKNGVDIPNATGAFLDLPGFQAGDAGDYGVRIANVTGTASAAIATLSLRPIDTSAGVISAATGMRLSLFIKSDGTLWGVSQNEYGELGNGTFTPAAGIPVHMADNVVRAAAGNGHSKFITADGTLWGMGANSLGQVGDGTGLNRTSPVQIATGVADVSIGGAASFFIKKDGSLWASGANTYGQLGSGTVVVQLAPVQVATNVKAVATSEWHTLFIKTDGTLWVMGLNIWGQLGDGTHTNRNIPIQIATGVTAVSVGLHVSHFVKADGSVWGMGLNDGGQLGTVVAPNQQQPTPIQITSGVTGVATGSSHVMFTKPDGSLWGMGYNEVGQAGIGSAALFTNSPLPVASNVIAVAAQSAYHTLYVTDDGRLWGTGSNDFLQLGIGSLATQAQFTPVVLASGPLAVPRAPDNLIIAGSGIGAGFHLSWQATIGSTGYEVWRSSSNDSATAIKITGNVSMPMFDDLTAVNGTTYYYWVKAVSPAGVSAFGIVGIPPFAPSITTQPLGQTLITGATAHFSVAATGLPTPDFQWQRRGVGSSTWANITDGAGVSGSQTATLTLGNPTAANHGDQYRCVVTNVAGSATTAAATLNVLFGSVITTQQVDRIITSLVPVNFSVTATGNPAPTYQWQVQRAGDSVWGNLSDGAGYSGSLTASLTVTGIQPENSGDQYRCVVTNVGGSATSLAATLNVVFVPGPIAVAAGGTLTTYLRYDGSLYAMGTNTAGQLGDGTSTAHPTPVPTLSGVTAMAAGAEHELVLKVDGSLWAHGLNQYGALGAGDTTSRFTPVQIAAGVAGVAAGHRHSLFIKGDGTLWAMGWNSTGQLGDGTTNDRWTPVQVATHVIAVTAGVSHSLFLKSDGTVWAMGDNSRGQLGDGTTINRLTPVQIATGATAIAAGGYHNLLLKFDGSLWGFGYNGFGQLGDGTTASRGVPGQVATGVRAISAGFHHSLFLKTDGTLWTMGYNDFGQIGDGTVTHRLTPFQLASAVTGLSAGRYHSAFVKADGSLWTVGGNNVGQLGDGTTTNRLTAVQIVAGLVRTPVAVSNYAASDGTAADRINLSWGAAGGATYYEVWRSTTPQSAAAVQLASRLGSTVYEDLTAAAGTLYYYWVRSGNGAGPAGFGVADTGYYGTLPVAPTITMQPQNQAVNAGASVTFTVGVSGTAPFTYQWRKGGTNLPSATAASYAIASAAAADAGSYDVIVTNPAGFVTSGVATLTVNALPQTITFSSLADRAYTTVPFTLSATASSGLTVAFSIVSGPATLSGNDVTLTGVGTVTVRAAQAGNASYAVATNVDRSFAVSKADATVTLGSLGATYDGAAKTATATTNPAGLNVTFTYDGGATPPTNAGSYAVVGTINDANYTGSASSTLTISKAGAMVTLGGLGSTYDGSAKTATATTNPASLAVTFTYDGGATAPTNAGSYAVVGSISSANYAGSASGTLVIAKADQTISFTGPANQPYSATPLTLSATATSGLTVTFSVNSGPATVSGPILTLTGSGPVSVRASQAGDANRNAAPDVDQSFTVAGNFAAWRQAKFTADELLDQSISGPNAVYGHDGLPNLVKYALGLEPKQDSTSGLPTVTTTATDWVYIYTRPVDTTDLSYAVEVSTDLTTWTTAGVTHELVSTGAGTETWRGRYPLASAANVFFRLKVVAP